MPTRLTLTLLLILLAAVIAAAAIFSLLNRPQPPAPSAQPLPARAAQPGRAAPNLALIVESITNTVTGQAVSAGVYLNDTLLRSLGKSVLRPQHYIELGNKRIFFAENHSLYSKFVAFQIRCSVSLPGDGPYGRVGRDPRGCAGL
jgi:hypothetical protein